MFSQQQLGVKSFKKLPNDLDARVNEPKKDQNGDLCAIIKVVTTQTGFSFDCGQIGIIKTVQKPSEIWVYVPYGAKRMTISHPLLGILRDYQLPLNIEKATVYELVLIAGNVITTVEQTIVSQWLVITAQPADAMIYINEKYVKNGSYQAKLKPGNYTYRVETPKYHTEAGKFVISDAKKEISVILKPAFGYANIISEPELGAKVIIDGESLNITTPCEKIQLSSGEHSIQVIKDNYQPSAQKITISDGETSTVKFTLNPNFSEVIIRTLPDAEIIIDNDSKGTGNWQGRLSLGVHTLEARLDKYKTARKDIEITAGDNQSIDLSPTPLFGSADIISSPSNAIIGVDGKNFGTTPNTIKDLSVGLHNLRLIKQGYSNIDTTFLIAEGNTTEVNLKMTNLASGAIIPPKSKSKPLSEKEKTIKDKSEYSERGSQIKTGGEGKSVVNNVSNTLKYQKAKTFWLASGLVTISAGTFSMLQAGKNYSEYPNATTEANNLHQKVNTFDKIYPICFVMAGACTLEYIITSGKQKKARYQTIGLYPQPVKDGAAVGLVYNF